MSCPGCASPCQHSAPAYRSVRATSDCASEHAGGPPAEPQGLPLRRHSGALVPCAWQLLCPSTVGRTPVLRTANRTRVSACDTVSVRAVHPMNRSAKLPTCVSARIESKLCSSTSVHWIMHGTLVCSAPQELEGLRLSDRDCAVHVRVHATATMKVCAHAA